MYEFHFFSCFIKMNQLEKLTVEPLKTTDTTEPNAPVLPPKPGILKYYVYSKCLHKTIEKKLLKVLIMYF